MLKNSTFNLVALFLSAVVGCSQAQSEPSQNNTWSSIATGQGVGLEVLQPDGFNTNQPSPAIIYLENLALPRGGTDSDEAIVHDFLANGYLVIKLDYGQNPKARVPYINADLYELRKEMQHQKLLSGLKLDLAHVYIIPSGSRLVRDVVYYREPGRTLSMDIIYPTHPVRHEGTVLEFSCDNVNRMGDSSLTFCSDTILEAEATEGLAVAMADHPVKAPYQGLDPMPDCARKIKAAVRTLRLEGAKLGCNGNIVPVGFSRGSGMALMLVTTKGMPEFEGFGENTNGSSDVQGAVVMSGRFTYLQLLPQDHMLPRYAKAWGEYTNNVDFWRREGAMDYLQKPTVPLFLTINCSESPDALFQMTVLRKRLAELGNDEIFMMDPKPRGHKVTLVPNLLTALDEYLKTCLAPR